METAEEKFNSNALYAMEHIMELVLYTPKSRPIEYKIDFLENNRKLSVERELLILEKLQEFKAIEIVSDNEAPNSVMPEARVIYLVIRQPKFDSYYQELKKPFRKKEEYQQKSVESLKKILGIIKHLKDEWDLTPRETSSQDGGAYTYYKDGYQTSISPKKYNYWMREYEINDFYELQNILTILEQEGLIIKADFINEAM